MKLNQYHRFSCEVCSLLICVPGEFADWHDYGGRSKFSRASVLRKWLSVKVKAMQHFILFLFQVGYAVVGLWSW